MSELLKVNACVYSRKGYESEQNRDDFYINGKFLSEHHLDNMEASIENRASEFFFAIADHMEYSDDDQRANFSILRDIGRFHEKITVHEGDINSKTKELSARVTETAKYLNSFHDMKNLPEEAPERQMGFAGLLLTEGKAVVATYGTSHIYFCRGGVFKHMTEGYSKPKRLVDLGIISDEEAIDLEEKYQSEEEENVIKVSAAEPVELLEGDKFLLISDGVYNTLGEEYIEDILSMRSDSTYIAYRIISEAMKKSSNDDMTAMVVRIDRVKPSSGAVKKTVDRPKASALKNVPPPTYKYKKKKRNVNKYENIIYYAAVFITAILLILILFFVIRNIMNNLSNTDNEATPTPIAIATVSPTPAPSEGTEETPTPEVTPTKAPVQITEYTIQQGDTLTSIANKHYGDNFAYVEKLGKYNNIPAPYNTIVVGEKIKIPPLEELMKVE